MHTKAYPLVLAALATALAVMFAASMYQRIQGPGLVLAPQHNHPVGMSQTDSGSNASSSPEAWQTPASLSPEDSAQLASLMAHLQTSPNDVPTLLGIAENFTRAQDWDKAQNFLLRAKTASPSDIRPLHMLALNYTRKKDYHAAETSFKAVLALENNPAATYSLAVLYQQYMNAPEQARSLLKALLDDPATPQAILDLAQRDMLELR